MPWIRGPEATPQVSVRERGRETVQALTETGQRLLPLREKQARGKKLTRKERIELGQLEEEYTVLEQRLRALLRPRDPHPELRGLDHTHGPESLDRDDH